MAGCTIPRIFGLQRWFDERFHDLCAEHDAYYVQRVWRVKVASDFLVAAKLADRGYVTLAMLSIPYLQAFGTIYWLWKKYV